MMGYWKNPELTAAALRDGWYHTGDLGYLDESGYLFLTDRKSDMIVSGGENVYPNEVENVLYTHPGVLECSVVAASDERWGEIVHAVIVIRDGRRDHPRGDHRALPPNTGRLQVPEEGDLRRQPAQDGDRQDQPQASQGGGLMTAKSLDSKIALVTGGCQGIGRAIVETLAAAGANVATWT